MSIGENSAWVRQQTIRDDRAHASKTSALAPPTGYPKSRGITASPKLHPSTFKPVSARRITQVGGELILRMPFSGTLGCTGVNSCHRLSLLPFQIWWRYRWSHGMIQVSTVFWGRSPLYRLTHRQYFSSDSCFIHTTTSPSGCSVSFCQFLSDSGAFCRWKQFGWNSRGPVLLFVCFFLNCTSYDDRGCVIEKNGINRVQWQALTRSVAWAEINVKFSSRLNSIFSFTDERTSRRK